VYLVRLISTRAGGVRMLGDVAPSLPVGPALREGFAGYPTAPAAPTAPAGAPAPAGPAQGGSYGQLAASGFVAPTSVASPYGGKYWEDIAANRGVEAGRENTANTLLSEANRRRMTAARGVRPCHKTIPFSPAA
jgi:hypothetical protein